MARLTPLLTALHRYDKSLSTWGRGKGTVIEAPVLAWLVETRQGRLLYDVGCDWKKLEDATLRERHYAGFVFGPPRMTPEQRLPALLGSLGLTPLDVDLVVLSHLHFDHAGGLGEVAHAEVHVQRAERQAASEGTDSACFEDEVGGPYRWVEREGGYSPMEGVTVIPSPGHTAGHVSLLLEREVGAPVVLCGDAADLEENLVDEVAPGLCWRDDPSLALESLRGLKRVARDTGAELWPNHDLAFYRRLISG
ncbi:MAG: N-acyl homoserine lactonase family protein [Archangium sp.]|nr:N-acyl homoserine lactonase family protein [Archangium sp.]